MKLLTREIEQRLYASVPQAVAKLKISRFGIHEAIKDGRLIAHRIGDVWLIERSSLRAYARRPRVLAAKSRKSMK